MEFLQTHEKNANDDVIQLSQVLVKALLTQQTLRRGFSTIEASFVELCDHLIVTFEPRDQDRSIKVEELIVDNKRPPKSFFAPKKGEPAIAIKIPEEPSITELIELINVVRNLVYSPTINNEGRIKLIAWIKRTKEYSQNLREAGIAMAYVSHLAIASANSLDTEAKKLNDLYLKSATLIYRLGDMIDVDRRVQNSQPDIFEALNEIMSINDHDKSKIDAALAKGIKYARFGKEYGEEDNLEEKYDINRAVEVYKWLLNRPTSFFLSGDVNSGSSGIIKSILENAIPSHVQSVDQQQAEIKQIPNDVAEALFIRGQEKVYQELRIPTWAKKFLKEDISQLTDEGIIKYLQKIGIDSLTFQHQVLSQFAPELQIIKETEEFKYLSLEEF